MRFRINFSKDGKEDYFIIVIKNLLDGYFILQGELSKRGLDYFDNKVWCE